MANLLDRSSLVLTPTAYNNGEALCIKPDDGSGDFQFSRNSAATRVNAQGLVENVQILSSNLVQNGDFSEEGVQEVSNGSFSQEGVELVTGTNSDMSGANSWVTGLGSLDFNINTTVQNKMWCNFTTGNQQVILPNTIEAGKSYLVSLTAKLNSGTATSVMIGGFTSNQTSNTVFNITPTSTTVTYSGYINSDTNTSLSIGIIAANNNGSDFEFDNVSVREVGQDWELQNGWSIGDDVAVFSGTASAYRKLYQENILTIGETYKLTFDIVSINSGSIKNFSQSNPTSYSTIGTKTEYFTATFDDLFLEPTTDADCSITNISVKEVGQNWDILDSVTSFSFNNGIANIQGTANYANNGIKQASISAVIGKTYKISATLRSNDGGLYRFRILDGSYFDLGSGNSAEFETITSYHTATSTSFTIFATSWFTNGTSNFDITNISIIEITTDTSLPRINYEGFSYQDALGSELVVNGTFDDGLNGWSTHSGSTLELENGMAKVTTSNNSGWIKRTDLSIETGKTYFCKADITNAISKTWYINGTGNSVPLTLISGNTYGGYVTLTGNNPTFYIKGNNTNGEVSYIDNVSVKEYLGQEVVPDSGCGSWLWEPQTTQLVPYSEDFSQSFWTKQASVTLDKGYLAPDGTYNATKISGVIGSSYVVSQGGILSSSSTKSIWAKTTSGTGVIHLGANQNQSNASFTVTNEWQRFEVTGTTTDVYAVDFRNASTTLSEVLVWGAQGENLSYATSYIPTNGEANGVTRNQDVCTNGGSLASINSTEGVLYAEIAALANDGTNRAISINNGGLSDYLFFRYRNNNQFQVIFRANNNNVVNEIHTLSNNLDFNKIAFSYKLNEFKLFINGLQIGSTITSGAVFGTTINSLDFDEFNGTNKFFGKTKAVAVWKEALSDEELTELTTI